VADGEDGLWIDGPADARDTLVLAHGAGAPADSPFLTRFARDAGRAGVRVVRFEFPYMRARRSTGRRGAPDREPLLRRAWLEQIEALGGGPRLVIGGKSMGGRIACAIADEARVRGVVCLGFPFHPPRSPERLRTQALAAMRTPTLIVQGTRDPFGTRAEVGSYALSPAVRLHWIEDGDHSLVPRARSGDGAERAFAQAVAAAIDFVRQLAPV
jgi:predicted alpha/beta-hydrolase family hydrolase